MKSLIKKTAESLKAALFLGFLSLSPAFIFSEQAFFQNENYSISVKYTKELVPGDAVFARMNLTPQKNHRKNQAGVKASLQLFRNGKLAESSPFYQINAKKSRQSIEMLSGVPVSIWTETEGNYELKIVFLQGDEKAGPDGAFGPDPKMPGMLPAERSRGGTEPGRACALSHAPYRF